jgi:RNA polymerase sigma-70 factor, ECF subfamily
VNARRERSEGWESVERALVERARDGDVGAFEEVVRVSSDRLYAIAYGILRDRDRAEDALQLALIRVWDDLPSLRDPDRFEAWSYRLVVRASYREARRERRWSSQVRTIDVEPASDGGHGRLAERDELERGFRRLTPEHRAVLVLHYYLGLPVVEIAETLGIPAGTAGSRLHYAVKSLRAAFEAEARGVVAWRGTS